MKLNNIIQNHFLKEKKGIEKLISSIEVENLKNFDKLIKLSVKAVKNKNKILFYGNGGSAADAQHLATELTVRFKKKRKAIAALSLSTDTSALTAIGNDLGFKYIFSRQIEAIGNSGDIAIAITTSGNSVNLIEASKTAKKKKYYLFVYQEIMEVN